MLRPRKTNCDNCGAPLPLGAFGEVTCPYCGSAYQVEDNVVRFVERRSGVIPLGCETLIDYRMLDYIKEKDALERATRELASSLAAEVVKYMNVEVQDDPYRGCKVIRGRIRILDKEFEF